MSLNWIVCPVRNGIHLTKKALETFKGQDMGNIRVFLILNDPDDGTMDWIHTQPSVITTFMRPPKSVARSWNIALGWLFDHMRVDHVLVVNNDVELRADTYRLLLEENAIFVTAVGSNDKSCLTAPYTRAVRPHPDFSCFLIRREAWLKTGRFDENFLGAYCEDWDYHCRLKSVGIEAYCTGLPFLHYGSGTIKSSYPIMQTEIQEQAEKNRAYFKAKHGFTGSSEEYYRFLGTSNPLEHMTQPLESHQDYTSATAKPEQLEQDQLQEPPKAAL